jgi:acetyl-CoA acetyltransferase
MSDGGSSARQVAIVGVGATAAGGHEGVPAAKLAVQAFRAALDDAGMDKSGVQAIIGGSLGGSTLDPEAFGAMIGLNPKITSALVYASSAFTLHHAVSMITAGLCDTVACVFARNPPGAQDALSGGDFVYNAAHGLVNANAAAALGASLHMARYGTTEEHLGHVAVAARANARLNPEAAFRDPLSLYQYLAQPQILWPFRRLDIALTNAAGVTVILARRDMARDLRKTPVYFEAMARQQAVRKLQNEDHLLCHPMRAVAREVYGKAGLSPADIDALYIYDATTAVVLQTLENYGFCAEGEGGPFVSNGRLMPGSGFPVNTQGGHLSGGYLFGWLHHVEIVRQLRNEAGPRQVPGARVAQFCTTGRFREDYASSIFVTE